VQYTPFESFGVSCDELLGDADLAGQPFEAFKTIGDHERVHAAAGCGQKIPLLVPRGKSLGRIDAEALADGTEGRGLVLLQWQGDEEIKGLGSTPLRW
jgi:hypothetical protein